MPVGEVECMTDGAADGVALLVLGAVDGEPLVDGVAGYRW